MPIIKNNNNKNNSNNDLTVDSGRVVTLSSFSQGETAAFLFFSLSLGFFSFFSREPMESVPLTSFCLLLGSSVGEPSQKKEEGRSLAFPPVHCLGVLLPKGQRSLSRSRSAHHRLFFQTGRERRAEWHVLPSHFGPLAAVVSNSFEYEKNKTKITTQPPRN